MCITLIIAGELEFELVMIQGAKAYKMENFCHFFGQIGKDTMVKPKDDKVQQAHKSNVINFEVPYVKVNV